MVNFMESSGADTAWADKETAPAFPPAIGTGTPTESTGIVNILDTHGFVRVPGLQAVEHA